MRPIVKSDARRFYRHLRRVLPVTLTLVARTRPRKGFRAPNKLFVAMLIKSGFTAVSGGDLFQKKNRPPAKPWPMEFE